MTSDGAFIRKSNNEGCVVGSTARDISYTSALLSIHFTFARYHCRHQQVKYSLQCRGKHVEDINKTELLDLLYGDIVLEQKVGSRALSRQCGSLANPAKRGRPLSLPRISDVAKEAAPCMSTVSPSGHCIKTHAVLSRCDLRPTIFPPVYMTHCAAYRSFATASFGVQKRMA